MRGHFFFRTGYLLGVVLSIAQFFQCFGAQAAGFRSYSFGELQRAQAQFKASPSGTTLGELAERLAKFAQADRPEQEHFRWVLHSFVQVDPEAQLIRASTRAYESALIEMTRRARTEGRASAFESEIFRAWQRQGGEEFLRVRFTMIASELYDGKEGPFEKIARAGLLDANMEVRKDVFERLKNRIETGALENVGIIQNVFSAEELRQKINRGWRIVDQAGIDAPLFERQALALALKEALARPEDELQSLAANTVQLIKDRKVPGVLDADFVREIREQQARDLEMISRLAEKFATKKACADLLELSKLN